jgi:hypothetical protein
MVPELLRQLKAGDTIFYWHTGAFRVGSDIDIMYGPRPTGSNPELMTWCTNQ